MNSTRVLRTATLCSALLFFSTTVTWAGCDNKDRPATPTGLKLGLGNPLPVNRSANFAIVLSWGSPQTRTGLTYYDIHVRDKSGKGIPGMDITGGAGQPAGPGGFGEYVWKNPPRSDEYDVSMRARTKAGTDGCISANESATAIITHADICNKAPNLDMCL